MVWGCLERDRPVHEPKFDRVFHLEGKHGEKLNELAQEIYRKPTATTSSSSSTATHTRSPTG